MGDSLVARMRTTLAAWTAQLHGYPILAAQIRSSDRDVRELALARLSTIMRATPQDTAAQVRPVIPISAAASALGPVTGPAAATTGPAAVATTGPAAGATTAA